MNLFVVATNNEWFWFLFDRNPEEVIWRSRGQTCRPILSPAARVRALVVFTLATRVTGFRQGKRAVLATVQTRIAGHRKPTPLVLDPDSTFLEK